MSLEQFHINESSSYYNRAQEPEPARHWSIGEPENNGSAAPPALWEMKRIGVFRAVAALIDAKAFPVVSKSDAVPLRLREFRGPRQNGHRALDELCSGRGVRLAVVTSAFLVALSLGWFGGGDLYP